MPKVKFVSVARCANCGEDTILDGANLVSFAGEACTTCNKWLQADLFKSLEIADITSEVLPAGSPDCSIDKLIFEIEDWVGGNMEVGSRRGKDWVHYDAMAFTVMLRNKLSLAYQMGEQSWRNAAQDANKAEPREKKIYPKEFIQGMKEL